MILNETVFYVRSFTKNSVVFLNITLLPEDPVFALQGSDLLAFLSLFAVATECLSALVGRQIGPLAQQRLIEPKILRCPTEPHFGITRQSYCLLLVIFCVLTPSLLASDW